VPSTRGANGLPFSEVSVWKACNTSKRTCAPATLDMRTAIVRMKNRSATNLRERLSDVEFIDVLLIAVRAVSKKPGSGARVEHAEGPSADFRRQPVAEVVPRAARHGEVRSVPRRRVDCRRGVLALEADLDSELAVFRVLERSKRRRGDVVLDVVG